MPNANGIYVDGHKTRQACVTLLRDVGGNGLFAQLGCNKDGEFEGGSLKGVDELKDMNSGVNPVQTNT